MTITRTSATDYTAIAPDGRMDTAMRLNGAVLRSHEYGVGHIRTSGLMRVTLGPHSLPQVLALAIGESVTLKGQRRVA